MDLKKWNEEFGYKVHDLNVTQKNMSLSFEKKSKEERAKINLERPTFMEEINWRQNLRAL